jgi:hypothetical protein
MIASSRAQPPAGALAGLTIPRSSSRDKPFLFELTSSGMIEFSKVHQQLRKVKLRVHLVPAASAGQTGKNRCGPPTTRVADEQRVPAIEYDPLHLPFTHIVIDGHSAISREHGQHLPLAERVVHDFGHGNFHVPDRGIAVSIPKLRGDLAEKSGRSK